MFVYTLFSTGTGISPMLGFLQAREKSLANGQELGKCLVLFGCRSPADFLHRAQMREWEQKGVISNLEVAFSRLDGQPKEYVQHRLAKIRQQVWDILQDDKCHYYVCGDSNMAEDVSDELVRTATSVGGLSSKNAWAHFQTMKQQHRFQTDTWGVVSNVKEGLARQLEKKYNQAAAWLETVTSDPIEEAPAPDEDKKAPEDNKPAPAWSDNVGSAPTGETTRDALAPDGAQNSCCIVS